MKDRLIRFAYRTMQPRKQPALPPDSEIRNIAVIKPCCLGDMLMATPAIRALAYRFPHASITVVTGAWTQPAIETNPRIDHVIRYPDANPILAAAQAARAMRRFKFDLGVSLDRSPATALTLRLAGIPIRAGIDSAHRGIGLTHAVQPERDQHESELYLSVVETLGVEELGPHPEYEVPDETFVEVRERVPMGQDRRLVVIHPGGAVNPGAAMLEKRWPATNFGELAQLLTQEAGATVAIVGTESDRSAIETVKQFARSPVIDLCGNLSLSELAALCKQASLYVGNDSGTTHLASAVGAPVVVIFGPTDPQKYRPLGRRTRVCAPRVAWEQQETQDLRNDPRADLPDIATVPLPAVLNACLDLLGGSR